MSEFESILRKTNSDSKAIDNLRKDFIRQIEVSSSSSNIEMNALVEAGLIDPLKIEKYIAYRNEHLPPSIYQKEDMKAAQEAYKNFLEKTRNKKSEASTAGS